MSIVLQLLWVRAVRNMADTMLPYHHCDIFWLKSIVFVFDLYVFDLIAIAFERDVILFLISTFFCVFCFDDQMFLFWFSLLVIFIFFLFFFFPSWCDDVDDVGILWWLWWKKHPDTIYFSNVRKCFWSYWFGHPLYYPWHPFAHMFYKFSVAKQLNLFLFLFLSKLVTLYCCYRSQNFKNPAKQDLLDRKSINHVSRFLPVKGVFLNNTHFIFFIGRNKS